MNIDRTALDLAKKKLLAHHKKVDELIFSARKRIENTYRKERKLLEQAVALAELDLSYAVDDFIAANPHPFEGKKVTRTADVTEYKNGRFSKWKQTGTFETVTSQTRFSKRDYARPRIGTQIVWLRRNSYVIVYPEQNWTLA